MTIDPAISEGQVLTGPLFSEQMRAETVRSNGLGSVEAGLVGKRTERFRRVTLTPNDIAALTVADSALSFKGDGHLLRLGLQAYSLGWHTSSTPTSDFRSHESTRCPISSRRSTSIS